MLLSTDFASENDLLDRVMEKGIVVEVWDRVEPAGIDMTGMQVSVSSIRLFTEGRNPPFRAGYFWKVDPLKARGNTAKDKNLTTDNTDTTDLN